MCVVYVLVFKYIVTFFSPVSYLNCFLPFISGYLLFLPIFSYPAQFFSLPLVHFVSFTEIPSKTFWRSFRTKILRFIEKVLECWTTREKDMQTLCLCEQRLSSSAINSKLFDEKAFHFSTFIFHSIDKMLIDQKIYVHTMYKRGEFVS